MTQPQTPQQTQPKPLSDLAYWLAVQHQQQQQEIADKTAAGLALLWGILQYDRLDETTPAWMHAVTLQVEQQFRVSEQAAFDFVQGSKWAVEPFSDPLKKVKTVFPLKDFQLAMRATGPATIKAATQRAFAAPVRQSDVLTGGLAPEVPARDVSGISNDVMALGKLTSTGAAVKQVLNGGRGEVQQLVVIDAKDRFANRQPIGWARFTEDSQNGPCYFCAILASQGAIYYSGSSFDRSNSKIRDFGVPKAQMTGEPYVDALLQKLNERDPVQGKVQRRAFLGDGPAKVHDHCKCTLRPVYREEDSMDARAKYFLRQWKNSGKGMGLKWQDQIKQFRRDYKKPPPYDVRPAVNLAEVRRNRELAARELGEDSPQVKWFDRTISALEIA